MSGPAPKAGRVRRNDPKKDFRVLSAAGPDAPVPAWPLQPDVVLASELSYLRDLIGSLEERAAEETDGRRRGKINRDLAKAELRATTVDTIISTSTDAEVALWEQLWQTPQAVMWREAHAEREVAQYVRWSIRAESGDLKAAGEARQRSDRLGLNPLALLRLRAEIERVDEAEDRGESRRRATPAKKSAARGRKKSDPRLALVSG